MWNEPIHVLGAGSIGLLWTASIRSRFPKYPITLLLRDHEKNRERVGSSAILKLSWNNRQLDHQQEKISLPVQFIHDSKHEKEAISTLIVATKAHQAKQAVESVLDRLLLPKKDDDDAETDHSGMAFSASSSPTQIIVLCNGALSVREELTKILPTDNEKRKISLAVATTTHGAFHVNPYQLFHAGVGTTFLEEQNSMTMMDLWNQAGLKCSSLSLKTMESILWNKLAANCVINPLTAIYKCTNGELLMEPSFPELQEEILKEVSCVAKGVSEDENSVPTIEEMQRFVSQTIKDTSNNRSSMYQDIHVGNQKTEIEHLNGYVVRKGRELGTDCPSNEDLCMRIAELSAQTSRKNR